MNKQFLYGVFLLGFFQAGYGSEVDSGISSDSESYDGVLDGLREKIAAMDNRLVQLEQRDSSEIQDEVSVCHVAIVALKKEISQVSNQAIKNELTGLVKQLLSRVQALFPKKEKVKKGQERKAEADLVLAPLPIGLEWYPEQHQYMHKGKEQIGCLAGLISQFPKGFCPDRGYVIIANGFIKKMIQEVRRKNNTQEPLSVNEQLVQYLFNLSPAGNVVVTALPANPVVGLSPELVGQLLRMLVTKSADYKDVFRGLWKTAYKALSHIRGKSDENFNNRANVFLKLVSDAYIKNEQATRDFLLAFVHLMIVQKKTAQEQMRVVQEYAKGLGLVYTPAYYTEDDFVQAKKMFESETFTDGQMIHELEGLLFCLKYESPAKAFYFSADQHALYDGKDFAACQENAFRTLLSCILGNPQTMSLDLGLLPDTIHVSEELKKFVKEHGDLQNGDYEKAQQAYIQLVENRPGILYSKGAYELKPTLENTIALLRLLFGITEEFSGSMSEEFVAIMHSFSTPEHQLEVVPVGDDKTFFVTLRVPKDTFVFSGKASFTAGHGDFILDTTDGLLDLKSPQLITNLFIAGKIVDQFLLGTVNISPLILVGELIKAGSITTLQELNDFFASYMSSFYPDYKAIFKAKDPEGYAVLFGQYREEIPSTTTYARLRYTLKNEKNIEGYRALLQWLIQENIFDKDLSKDILLTIFNQLVIHKDYLLAAVFLKEFSLDLLSNNANELFLEWRQIKRNTLKIKDFDPILYGLFENARITPQAFFVKEIFDKVNYQTMSASEIDDRLRIFEFLCDTGRLTILPDELPSFLQEIEVVKNYFASRGKFRGQFEYQENVNFLNSLQEKYSN